VEASTRKFNGELRVKFVMQANNNRLRDSGVSIGHEDI